MKGKGPVVAEPMGRMTTRNELVVGAVGRVTDGPPARDVHTLITRSCDYVLLHGKWGLRQQMELRW